MEQLTKRGRKRVKKLFSLDESISLFPIPFYFPFLQVNSNMNQYETLSPVNSRLIEKQGYNENTANFKETDVSSHLHIPLPIIIMISPLFTALSFHHIPLLYLWEHLLQLSPAKFQKGSQHTCLSSVIHRPIKLLTPTQRVWGVTKEESRAA